MNKVKYYVCKIKKFFEKCRVLNKTCCIENMSLRRTYCVDNVEEYQYASTAKSNLETYSQNTFLKLV